MYSSSHKLGTVVIIIMLFFFFFSFSFLFSPFFFGQLNTKFYQHRPDSKFIDSGENFLYGFQSVSAPRDLALHNFGIISLICPSHKAIHDLCGALQLPQECIIPTKTMCHWDIKIINFYFHLLSSPFSVAESCNSGLPIWHCIDLGQTFATALESTFKGLLFTPYLGLSVPKIKLYPCQARIPGTWTLQSTGWWGIFPETLACTVIPHEEYGWTYNSGSNGK